MKPAVIGLIPIAALFAAAAVSRISVAAQEGTGLTSPTITEAAATVLFPQTARATRSKDLGRLPFRGAERIALASVEDRASLASGPAGATWSEDYGHWIVQRRLIYDPAHCVVFYQTGGGRPCIYSGITRAGIQSALAMDTAAPLATAHTLSYNNLIELARGEL